MLLHRSDGLLPKGDYLLPRWLNKGYVISTRHGVNSSSAGLYQSKIIHSLFNTREKWYLSIPRPDEPCRKSHRSISGRYLIPSHHKAEKKVENDRDKSCWIKINTALLYSIYIQGGEIWNSVSRVIELLYVARREQAGLIFISRRRGDKNTAEGAIKRKCD